MSFDETVAPDGLLTYKIDWSQIEKKEGKRRTFYIKLYDKKKNLLYKPYIDKPSAAFYTDPLGKVTLLAGSNLKFDESTPGMALVAIEDLENGSCKGKFCIGMGTESKLIQEVNIRLAGFGGNVPTKKFTPRTLKMINQFQKDYMGIEPTGKICGDTLKAIDDFSEKFDVSNEIWNQLSCSCSGKGKKLHNKLNNKTETNNCKGWGDKSGKNTYKNSSQKESMHKYEYPGIHRSLLFGLKALLFYMSEQKEYEFAHISSGYRCRFKQYKTTNHQGKAMDIQFNKENWKIRGQLYKNIKPLKDIRKKFFEEKLVAKTNWTTDNHFSMEPIGLNKNNTKINSGHTHSWIHMDVRKFDSDYLKEVFFCTDRSSLNSKRIVHLAKKEGFENTCACMGGYKAKTEKTITKCETCTSLEKRRLDFYNQVGQSSINYVESLSNANKFKGLYMVAQRRQENGFHLVTPGNNPMNIKGKGDAGQIQLNTHEYINGKRVNMKDGFAKFTTMEKGFEGYANLLMRNFNDAYISLTNDDKTIDDFLSGLQDKGRTGSYATAPNYKPSIKKVFHGVISDYKKWLECKLSCNSFNKKSIEKDIEMLEKLK